MKNTYELEITASCPADGKPDVYRCVVRSDRTIPVETILAAVTAETRDAKYQEDLTRDLHRVLAAEVEMTGWHSGVFVRSVAGAGE